MKRKVLVMAIVAATFLLHEAPGFAQEEGVEDREVQHARKPGWPSPVEFGVQMELGDVSLAEKWLNMGLPPNFEGDRIGTGLMIGAWEGNVRLMEMFLSRGADVNFVNKSGEQAILHAAWRGKMDAVKWLIEHGASLNRVEAKQWSALHYAVFAGHKDIAQYLISKGADVNALSTNGSSVLMMAAREGQEELAKALLELGADTKPKNDWGDGALEWAMKNNNLKIAKMVATAEQFAEAMSMPKESWGKSMRSIPLPESLEELLRQQRQALARGEPSEHLRMRFIEALAKLAKEKPLPSPQAAVPMQAKLVIKAKRSSPGEQSGELLFKESYLKDPFSSKPSAKSSLGR